VHFSQFLILTCCAGCLNIFYSQWKLDAFYNARVHSVVSDLFRATFASGVEAGFEHDFGAFDPTHSLAYFDRAAFRFPDSVKPSGGLALHVDMNIYDANNFGEFWRPLQMSLALTEHVDELSGGIGFAPGWHRRIVERCRLLKNRNRQFNILDETEFADVHADKRIVAQPIGSLCIWDNRLPHFVSETFDSPTGDTRQVLFSTFLPDVPLNRVYAARTLSNMLRNVTPPDFKAARADFDVQARRAFSPLQEKIFGLTSWDDDADADDDAPDE
jgi:hypothetical protein